MSCFLLLVTGLVGLTAFRRKLAAPGNSSGTGPEDQCPDGIVKIHHRKNVRVSIVQHQ